MTDATQKCPVCGSANPARAKFCGECGAPMRGAAAAATTTPARGRAGNPVLPWFVAGCFVLALQTAVIAVSLHRTGAAEPDATLSANSAAPVASRGTATDISQMTPREAADRLYERIARAAEAGDTGQVNFFAPMALSAYGNVTPLDADARLHVGLIDLATGNAAAATAQGDSIVRQSPTHLFGPMLRARAAEARGNRAAARDAYRAFLANYDAERRKNLPEYAQHEALLTETRTAAQRTGR